MLAEDVKSSAFPKSCRLKSSLRIEPLRSRQIAMAIPSFSTRLSRSPHCGRARAAVARTRPAGTSARTKGKSRVAHVCGREPKTARLEKRNASFRLGKTIFRARRRTGISRRSASGVWNRNEAAAAKSVVMTRPLPAVRPVQRSRRNRGRSPDLRRLRRDPAGTWRISPCRPTPENGRAGSGPAA